MNKEYVLYINIDGEHWRTAPKNPRLSEHQKLHRMEQWKLNYTCGHWTHFLHPKCICGWGSDPHCQSLGSLQHSPRNQRPLPASYGFCPTTPSWQGGARKSQLFRVINCFKNQNIDSKFLTPQLKTLVKIRHACCLAFLYCI